MGNTVAAQGSSFMGGCAKLLNPCKQNRRHNTIMPMFFLLNNIAGIFIKFIVEKN